MYSWQPAKWLQFAIVGAGLPWLGASWLSTDSLVSDVSTRALTAVQSDWAKIQSDGRDITITGDAPSKEAADAAIAAVQNSYGVRTVNAAGVKVAPPPPVPEPLAAPTVEALTSDSAQPEIKGSWPEGKAKSLDVTVNGTTYSLGKSPELSSKDGSWDLKLSQPLAPGAYDVTATAGDGDKQSVATPAPAKVVINAPPPPPPPAPLPAPTIDPSAVESGKPVTVTGTWPEGQAKSLSVGVNGKNYELGKDQELTSHEGKWSLNLGAPLASGSYDVTASAGDGGTAAATAAAPAKIEVAAPPPPPPPAPVPAAAPTINAPKIEEGQPVTLSGTWAAGAAQSLHVTVNGQAYQLGKDFDLLSDTAGKWSLKLKPDLPPGKYDVVVESSDATGAAQKASASFDIAAPAAVPAPTAPAPQSAAAPTLDVPKVEEGKPVTLSGTWAAGVANSLSVTVNDMAFQLGKDFSLLSDTAGKWKVQLKPDLPPGKYAVTVMTTDATGTTQKATGDFEVAAPPAVVAPPPPAPAAKPLTAPTIDSVKSDKDRPTITGTWPVGNGNTLEVELDGVTHTLGKDTDLLSDTAGKWTLTPAKPVVNGTYDIVAKVTGPDGQSITDASKDELTVSVAAPPPAPPPSQPYDCEATLARIAAVFPIRFEFNHTDLAGPYPDALAQYAALLKDKRCATVKLQIAGHADYFGSEAYNLTLSEQRAQSVIDALAKAGIETSRMSGIGFGKTKPLDPAHSNGARAKNRRVEFTEQK